MTTQNMKDTSFTTITMDIITNVVYYVICSTLVYCFIVWSNNLYIKYTYYVFSVYKIHVRFPH